jgi:hypothetical protein
LSAGVADWIGDASVRVNHEHAKRREERMDDMSIESIGVAPGVDSTARAQQEGLLNPRFYTTDYKAMDRLDITPVRREWDEMMAEF